MSFLRIIGGLFKSRQIKAPKTASVRPTASSLRESVFNICQNRIEGAFFLDLFSGSGAMGIEALSRNAAYSVCIDNDKEAFTTIQENIQALGLQKVSKVILGDVFSVLPRLGKGKMTFGIVYIDPPYRFYEEPTFISRLFSTLDKAHLLQKESILFIEEALVTSKAKDLSCIPKNFIHVRSRRFGSSLLHEYKYEYVD